jgi:hypothetical protein
VSLPTSLTTPRATPLLEAALALHAHLERQHLAAGVLFGPDPSGRLNLRVGRFVKAALSSLPWSDRWVSYQGLGYWVRWNALLARLMPQAGEFRAAVRSTCDALLARQRADGAWSFRDGGDRVATFESTWAALGLLEGARLLDDERYLSGAQRWVTYLIDGGAFHPFEGGLFVTYWSNATFAVPNNSAEVLWLFSEMARFSPEPRLATVMRGLVTFLTHVQQPSGEMPYLVPTRQHYLCFQYNAFEFLAMARYADNTGDPAIEPLLSKLAAYLLTGAQPDGACRTSCSRTFPEVDYYTAALGLALVRAERFIGPSSRRISQQVSDRLLGRQRSDGSFGYSRADYGLPMLEDRRSYPRPQAMIGYCLAALACLSESVTGQRDGVAL